MADENMTQDPDAQGKKITVKLKPLALEKATGEQTAANVNIPTAPAGASASATVKFNHKAVAASEPEMPTAQDLAKQTIKLAPPPRTGLPKPPAPLPSASAAPASPVLKKATQIVKAVETPEVPASPVLKKATQVVKVETPAADPAAPVAAETPAAAATQVVKKPGLVLPKKPAAEPATPVAVETPATPVAVENPAAAATQAVKKPGLILPKKPAAEPAAEPAAPAAVETPAAAATQAVKKPGLILPKKPAAEPAAPAEESEPKKPGLILPKKPVAESAAPAAPAEESEPKKPGLILPKKPVAEPAAPAGIDLKKPGSGDADAKRVQEEGLKPKEGGSGLGLKKVEKVAEEDLPDSLKQEGAVPSLKAKVILGPQNEPGPVFTTIVVLAFIILLIGVYVQFFGYAKWMPEMDAHINSLPAPPTGVFPK